jgi:hypothetical protein
MSLELVFHHDTKFFMWSLAIAISLRSHTIKGKDTFCVAVNVAYPTSYPRPLRPVSAAMGQDKWTEVPGELDDELAFMTEQHYFSY